MVCELQLHKVVTKQLKAIPSLICAKAISIEMSHSHSVNSQDDSGLQGYFHDSPKLGFRSTQNQPGRFIQRCSELLYAGAGHAHL